MEPSILSSTCFFYPFSKQSSVHEDEHQMLPYRSLLPTCYFSLLGHHVLLLCLLLLIADWPLLATKLLLIPRFTRHFLQLPTINVITVLIVEN